MRAKIIKGIKWASILLAVVAIGFFAIRVYAAQRGPPLSRWHTYVPHDLKAKELDATDWDHYLAREAKIFDDVRTEVTEKLNPDERVPMNRYFDGSPIYPAHFTQDFNRSYVLEPSGTPVGAVVLLHGLTDSPYSQRHIAKFYRDHGFVAIVIRLPGHGTVPAGTGRCRMGRLDGSDAACRAGSPPSRRTVGAAASGWILERRRACGQICTGLDCRPAAQSRRPRRLDFADDRHHALCAFRRAGRSACAVPCIRQSRLARRGAGIQSIQIQLVSGQRRRSIVSADASPATADRGLLPLRPTGRSAADRHLPIGHGLHGQHVGHYHGAVLSPSGQRQRACAVRRQPNREPRCAAASRRGYCIGHGFCPAERGTTEPRSLPMPMSPAAKKSSAASRPAAWPKSIAHWALPIRTAFFHSLTSRCRFR